MKEVYFTPEAPAAIGPYSQAWRAGDFLFTAGQGPNDPATGEVVGTTITEQAEQTMKNIGAILKEAGTDFTSAVKVLCFLADAKDFKAFNEVYAKYFTTKPARTCVMVKDFPEPCLCEVEVICYLGK
ncbi:MAG: Rid family detoxifying hydrolase [Eubacterium sp.]|jgi:2-iminobutanoate/2-iminopropanoate deaminase